MGFALIRDDFQEFRSQALLGSGGFESVWLPHRPHNSDLLTILPELSYHRVGCSS